MSKAHNTVWVDKCRKGPHKPGPWDPDTEAWYPRNEPEGRDGQYKTQMAIAKMYDYGYRVELIMEKFDITPAIILYACKRFCHRPIVAERFAHCDTPSGSGLTRATVYGLYELGLANPPEPIHWTGTCKTCGSTKADGCCVYCNAKIAAEVTRLKQRNTQPEAV